MKQPALFRNPQVRASFALPGAKADHAHGTRARYVLGCRCAECRSANTRRYHAKQARGREIALGMARGETCPGVEGIACGKRLRSDSLALCSTCRDRASWNGLVDAAPVRRHLRRLSRRGVGRRAVSAASDVPESTLSKILRGERRQIRKWSAERILAVTSAAASDHGRVDARETWRMLRVLIEEYMTRGEVARQLGCKRRALQIGKRRVLASTELRVRKLYRRAVGAEALVAAQVGRVARRAA